MQNPELPKAIAKSNRRDSLTDEEEIALSILTQDLFIGCVVSMATGRRSKLFYDNSTEVEYLVRILEANRGFIGYWHKHKTLFHSVSPLDVDAVDTRISNFTQTDVEGTG